MACVALASLMSTIKLQFLQPIPRVSLFDQTPIQSLFERICCLQGCLEESSGSCAAAIKDLEIIIRDFALKAEDDIEIQLCSFLLSKDTEHRERASQKLHQTLQGASEKATELLRMIYSTSKSKSTETQPSIHRLKHASEWGGSSTKLVGRDNDRRSIIKKLIFGDLNLNVISIVGMVGIGKTTLARCVSEDPRVATFFPLSIWISMPQEYSNNQILRHLLRSISPQAEKKVEEGSPPTQLAKEIRKQLYNKRYLIVLDSLQYNWNDIGGCFPKGRNGSRILITTMHFDRYVHTGSSFYVHNMNLLNPKESWDLFFYIHSLKRCMAPEFEKIRSDIVEICDGLPWSILVVANRLSKSNHILKEWKKIKKEIETLGILDQSALTFVYNQLSQSLKVCFLYFGVFPKRKEIVVKELIRLWIVEGFLEPLEHEELENQGYAYLQKLIDRSLVLVCNRSSNREIRSCRMHNALHSFCVGEAQKMGILCALNTLQHSGLPLSEFANSCRWLSLYTHSFDYYVVFSTNHCRSIFFFNEDPETFIPFKLLRVLAFVPPLFLQRLSMHIGDLIFLRYLSVTQWFEGLDVVLSSNLNLQTLIFAANSESQLGAPTLCLPSTIWVSPQLRHLLLGHMYTVNPPSMVKKNLQTLSWVVDSTHCEKEVYFHFPDIKKLKIFYKEDLEPSQTNGSSSKCIILDNLDHIKCLERLTILVSFSCTITLREPSMFLSQLKKLKLSGTKLSQWNLMVIGRLPKLEYLKLENVLFGKVWVVTKGKFRALRFLVLEEKKLRKLIVKDGSFPSLECLVLRFCYRWPWIPNQLASCHGLKSMELERCKPSIIDSAKSILKGLQLQRGEDNIFELIIDGAKYVEPQSADLLIMKWESAYFLELDEISSGYTVEAIALDDLRSLVLYFVIVIIFVLLERSRLIPRLFVIPSSWFLLRDFKWILPTISLCLACIGLVIFHKFFFRKYSMY